MRPILFIITLLLSCGLPPHDPAAAFLQRLNLHSPGTTILKSNDLIPVDCRFLKYPYHDTSVTVRLRDLLIHRQPAFLFFLGSNYLGECDICVSEQLDLIKNLSADGNMPVIFISDNQNPREMAVFRNRHNLDNLYMLADSNPALAQYDYSSFIIQIR